MRALLSLCVALGLTAAGSGSAPGQAEPGNRAPLFSLPGSDGKTYNLADFKGKQAVVLAWFTRAFTGA